MFANVFSINKRLKSSPRAQIFEAKISEGRISRVGSDAQGRGSDEGRIVSTPGFEPEHKKIGKNRKKSKLVFGRFGYSFYLCCCASTLFYE